METYNFQIIPATKIKLGQKREKNHKLEIAYKKVSTSEIPTNYNLIAR